MQSLRVGILQLDQIWEQKQANFDRVNEILDSPQQIDLLLLPEMFHTAFSMNVSLADDWQHSEGLSFLKGLSEQNGFAIFASLMVKDGTQFYNRGVFVEPDGKVNIYDKRKSFGLGGEDQFFSKGFSEQIVTYKNWKINLQICYDLRFPELIRNRSNSDGGAAYDVLLYVANWPQKRSNHWDALLLARAIENQCYVVACNRVGHDANDLTYNGHSQAIDMFGNYLVEPLEQEAFFVVELSYATLREGRKSLPFLKDA
jgi:omega-amidase